MAQFYTLEEAARVLGMSPEELKSKAQHREIRAFLDGGSWRFRVVDIDELARRRGLGSDAELRLSDLEVPAAGGEDLDDLDLSEFQLGVAKPDLANETMDLSAMTSSSGERPVSDSSAEHAILFDDLSVPPGPVTGSSSVIIGMQSSGKQPSDSDVRLVPDNVKGSSDSDVRLASPDPDLKQPSDSDVTLIKDDTSDHHLLTPASGSSDTAVRKARWSVPRPRFRPPSRTVISSSIPQAISSMCYSRNRAAISSSAPWTPATSSNRRPCARAIRT